MTFLDTLLQMSLLVPGHRNLRLPTRITAIHIDPTTHRQKLYALQGETQGSPALAPHTCVPAPGAAHTYPACPRSGRRGSEQVSEQHSGRQRPRLEAPCLGGPSATAGAAGTHPGKVLLHTARGERVPGWEPGPAGGAAAVQG